MPQVYDSGEPNEHSLDALIHLAFPLVVQGRHSRPVISELHTAPMHTPANASPRHCWSSRHSSGPGRVATPYPVEDLTSSTNHQKSHPPLHAGFNRRFHNVPFSRGGYPGCPALKEGEPLPALHFFGFRSRYCLRQCGAFTLVTAVGNRRETYSDICPFAKSPESACKGVEHELVLAGVGYLAKGEPALCSGQNGLLRFLRYLLRRKPEWLRARTRRAKVHE